MPNLTMVERKHSFLSFFNRSKINSKDKELSLKPTNSPHENTNNKPPDPGGQTIYSPFAQQQNYSNYQYEPQLELSLENEEGAIPGSLLNLHQNHGNNQNLGTFGQSYGSPQGYDQNHTNHNHSSQNHRNSLNNASNLGLNLGLSLSHNDHQTTTKPVIAKTSLKQKIFKNSFSGRDKTQPDFRSSNTAVNRSKSSVNLFSRSHQKSAGNLSGSNIYLSSQKTKNINITSEMKTAMYVNDLQCYTSYHDLEDPNPSNNLAINPSNNSHTNLENNTFSYSRKLLTLNSEQNLSFKNRQNAKERVSQFNLDDNPNFLSERHKNEAKISDYHKPSCNKNNVSLTTGIINEFRKNQTFRDKNDFEFEPGDNEQNDGVGGENNRLNPKIIASNGKIHKRNDSGTRLYFGKTDNSKNNSTEQETIQTKGGYPTSFLKPSRASSFLHLRPGRSKTSINMKDTDHQGCTTNFTNFKSSKNFEKSTNTRDFRDSGGGSGSPELSSKITGDSSSDNNQQVQLSPVSKPVKSGNILKSLRRSLTNVGLKSKSVLSLGNKDGLNTPKLQPYKRERAIESLYDRGNLYDKNCNKDNLYGTDTGISSYAAETRSNNRSNQGQYTDLDNTSSNLVRNLERQKLSPVSSSSNGNDLAPKFSYEEDTGNNSDSPLANRKNVDKVKSHQDVRNQDENRNRGNESRNCYSTQNLTPSKSSPQNLTSNRNSVGMDSTKAAAVRKHKLQEQILEDGDDLENLAPSPPDRIGESRTASSVTTSTRSVTGSDVDETTSSEDGNFYEDQRKDKSNIPRHLPPSGARLQKSKTFVARGSRRQGDCYASTNNCYNGSQAELETTHHNPYTMELSRMPTVSQRMGDSKPVSRHASLSGKHHYQGGTNNSQSYQQRTGIGKSNTNIKTNSNHHQSSSHQDIYGSSKFYKKPVREREQRDDDRDDYNYDRDFEDKRESFDDKRNFYEKTPDKIYEKSYDNKTSDFKSEFKSFDRNYDYRNSSSNRFERSVNNHRTRAGNTLHQVVSAPALTQSQINEKIQHEMAIGRKTNIQLNLLMNKTALWVNRQRFEVFCDNLNDNYT